MPSQEKLSQCESLIRAGKMDQAREIIATLNRNKMNPSQMAMAANLARRTGLFSWGLRLLRGRIYPEKILNQPVTDAEICVYAALLIKLGARDEALELLRPISGRPEATLYRSFAYISSWNYSRAIPHLEEYVLDGRITGYERAVGQVNLASAYVHSANYLNAEIVLAELEENIRANGWTLLQGSTLEIAGHMAMKQSRWDLAESYLRLALGDLNEYSNVRLFARKWQAVLPLLRDGAIPKNIIAIEELRAEAERSGQWEIVRDCDFHRAVMERDADRFAHVYFGTAHAAYRTQMEFSKPNEIQIPQHYLRQGSERAKRIFDMSLAQEVGGHGPGLKAGQGIHRLLMILSNDFYRPMLVGTIASILYPNEYFHPVYSLKRVAETVRRTRSWLKEERWAMQIKAGPDSFQLFLTGSAAVLHSQPESEANGEATIHAIYPRLSSLPFERFSSAEAAHHMGVSVRTANKILNQAIADGKVERTGNGKATQYIWRKERAA